MKTKLLALIASLFIALATLGAPAHAAVDGPFHASYLPRASGATVTASFGAYTYFRAAVNCSDNTTRFGPARSSASQSSTAYCPVDTVVVYVFAQKTLGGSSGPW